MTLENIDKAMELPEEIPATTKADIGIELTADQITDVRLEIRSSAQQIDSLYYRLGGMLYLVYSRDLYTDWGYESFDDYLSSEINYKSRKAYYLMNIYYTAEYQSPALKASIEKGEIPWSKAREIAPLIAANPSEEDEWIKAATDLTHKELTEKIKEVKNIDEDGNKKQNKSDALETRTYTFYPDQIQNVQEAIERAGELTGNNGKGFNLSMVCMEYLATHTPSSSISSRLLEEYKRSENFKDEMVKFFVSNIELMENLLKKVAEEG